MLILQLIILLYVLSYGKKMASTKYIFWFDFTIWCVFFYKDMANPSGLGLHFAELALFSIVVICYVIAYRKYERTKRIEKENHALQEQLKMYEQQIEAVKEQNDKVCRIKHDLKNQFLYLSSLATSREWEHIQEIIDETLGELAQNKYVNTGNSCLDSLLNYKIATAKKNNITIQTNICIPEDCIYNDQTTILSLGNLLDNAIEACMKLSPDKRLMSIKMERKDTRTLLLVTNSFDGKVSTDRKGNIITTKKDTLLHGIGLKNVKNILKNKGDFEYKIEKNLFIAKVILY